MQVMVLTGGIACGKSTAGAMLRETLPSLGWFDCDAVVGRLLDGDALVADEIGRAFGEAALDASGRPDRGFLRQRVFGDAAARCTLEGILHPRVLRFPRPCCA